MRRHQIPRTERGLCHLRRLIPLNIRKVLSKAALLREAAFLWRGLVDELRTDGYQDVLTLLPILQCMKQEFLAA